MKQESEKNRENEVAQRPIPASKEYRTGTVWMLPILHYRGAAYFVDQRLRQFRAVQNPHDFIDFKTPQGTDMLIGFVLGGEHDDDR